MRWIADNYSTSANILGHNRPSTDHAALAQFYSWQDRSISTNGNIIFNNCQ